MSVTAESPDLLLRVAELRAAGASWADTAVKLAVGHDELRRRVADHHRDYERLTRRARTELLRETLDAALTALRTQIHSADPRLSYMAACTVVRYELARMRHGTQQARERLDRDLSPHGRNRRTTNAENSRAQNMSESTEVQTQQKVAAPKNVAQPTASPTPRPAPAASPASTKQDGEAGAASKQKDGEAGVASKQKDGEAGVASKPPISPEERERRRRLLLNNFVHGRGAPPPDDNRLDQAIQRLVDDAPPG
jgi:hypothetical protein